MRFQNILLRYILSKGAPYDVLKSAYRYDLFIPSQSRPNQQEEDKRATRVLGGSEIMSSSRNDTLGGVCSLAKTRHQKRNNRSFHTSATTAATLSLLGCLVGLTKLEPCLLHKNMIPDMQRPFFLINEHIDRPRVKNLRGFDAGGHFNGYVGLNSNAKPYSMMSTVVASLPGKHGRIISVLMR